MFRLSTLKGIYGREMFETWRKMLAMLESGLDIRKVITARMKAGGEPGKIILEWS